MKQAFVTVLLSLFLLLPLHAERDRSEILKVYNWADYIDEDLIPEFEAWYKKQTGKEIHVQYETFDINENMLTEIEMGHEDYDCVCPSEYIIERMLRKMLLQPIQRDFGKTPDYTRNVSPYFTHLLSQMGGESIAANDYAVGYMWGTTGWLYNTKYVNAEDMLSWDALLNPKFSQRIFMKDAVRDVYSTLVLYARYQDIMDGVVSRDELVARVTPENLQAVEKVLREAKPNIAGWEVDFGKEMMTKGKAWVNLTWSGDAMWAIEEAAANGVSLDYQVPKEGSNVWFDGWVIPIYARNPKAASYFINFLCMSENAIRNMDEIGYVSVVATPEVMDAMVDYEIKETYDLSYFFRGIPGADSLHINPIQYPDCSVIARCALMHDAGGEMEEMMEMWSRVKGDSLNRGWLTFVCVSLGLLFIGIIYYKVKRKKSHRRKTVAS
jgi:spermidine/putrescine transport system substrate-binding protein